MRHFETKNLDPIERRAFKSANRFIMREGQERLRLHRGLLVHKCGYWHYAYKIIISQSSGE